MLKEGHKAPPFVLPSSDGTTVDINDLRGTTTVLYFYPRDNTPGCTIEAQDFTRAVPELKKHGAVVLGVSKDSIESHCKFRDKYGLAFPLLTDADGKVMTAYGAWGDKMMYGKKVTGIIRSTVLIDKDGTVVRHWPKVSVKGHADAVVEAVKALGPRASGLAPRAQTQTKTKTKTKAKTAAKKTRAKKPVAKKKARKR
jgi:thioredoxin-dependent peroxiredoxin